MRVSAFDAAKSQLTFRIWAATEGLGGGAKTGFALGRGKP